MDDYDVMVLLQRKARGFGFDANQDESALIKEHLRRLLALFPLECDEVLGELPSARQG